MTIKILTKVLNLKTFTLDDDDFASLKGIDNNDQNNREFVYEFRYIINMVEAIKKNAKSVCISILPRTPNALPNIFEVQQFVTPNPPKTGIGASFISQVSTNVVPSQFTAESQTVQASTIVQNILAKSANTKAVKVSNTNLVVRKVCSDITAKFSNSAASNLATNPLDKSSFLPNFTATAAKPTKKLVLKHSSALKQESTEVAVLQVSKLSPTNLKKSVNSSAKLAISSILQHGVDPTEALSTKYVVNTSKAIKGTIQESPTETKTNLSALSLAKTFLVQNVVDNINDLDEGTLVPMLIKQSEPNISINTSIRIREEDIEGDAFYVKFELVDNEGLTIEQTTKKVKHGNLVRLFFTPTIAPKVVASSFKRVGQNTLEITQLDPTATAVRIFRKVFSRTQQISTLRYQFVQQIDLSKEDGTRKFVDFTNNTSRMIYRIIPVGPTGIQGFQFTNVVSKPVRFRNTRKDDRHVFSVVVAKPAGSGINIEVSNVTPGPIALKVVRRDLTLHEKQFSTVIDHISSNQKSVLLNDLDAVHIFIDRNVKTGHVYEYTAIVIFADGDEEYSTGCDTIEFIPFSEGAVKISTTTPEIINTIDGIDVQFKIESIVTEKNLDKVKKLLEAQGLGNVFEEEIKKEKDKLASLIAHKIDRIDLTTGEREQFVTITTNQFSDVQNQGISSVKPLEVGHSYLYLISTLLRTPETMLESFEKTKKDAVLNKEFTFKPSKFLHPVTLTKGNIVTSTSLLSNHAKGEFEFGNIGNLHSVAVSLKDIVPEISNPIVKQVSSNMNVVSWRVSGNKDAIDHFVVIQRRLRMEEVVGKAHAITDSDVIEFVDLLDSDETGEMQYRIVPVFNTYRRGSAITTDKIVV